MSLAVEVGRLRAAWPSPGWDDDRLLTFIQVLIDCEERHVAAGIDRILRDWTADFPPSPAQVREWVMQEARRGARSNHAAGRLHPSEREVPWRGLAVEATVLAGLRRRGIPCQIDPSISMLVELVDHLGYVHENGPGGVAEDPDRHRLLMAAAEDVWAELHPDGEAEPILPVDILAGRHTRQLRHITQPGPAKEAA